MSENKLVRYAAKSPEHGGLGIGIAGANEGDSAGMAEDFPEALGALDRRCRTCAFESFAGDKSLLGLVDGHGNELSDFTHESFLGSFLKLFLVSQRLFSTGVLIRIKLAAPHAASRLTFPRLHGGSPERLINRSEAKMMHSVRVK